MKDDVRQCGQGVSKAQVFTLSRAFLSVLMSFHLSLIKSHRQSGFKAHIHSPASATSNLSFFPNVFDRKMPSANISRAFARFSNIRSVNTPPFPRQGRLRMGILETPTSPLLTPYTIRTGEQVHGRTSPRYCPHHCMLTGRRRLHASAPFYATV